MYVIRYVLRQDSLPPHRVLVQLRLASAQPAHIVFSDGCDALTPRDGVFAFRTRERVPRGHGNGPNRRPTAWARSAASHVIFYLLIILVLYKVCVVAIKIQLYREQRMGGGLALLALAAVGFGPRPETCTGSDAQCCSPDRNGQLVPVSSCNECLERGCSYFVLGRDEAGASYNLSQPCVCVCVRVCLFACVRVWLSECVPVLVPVHCNGVPPLGMIRARSICSDAAEACLNRPTVGQDT